MARPSPARLAQLELAARLTEEGPVITGGWSPRRTIGFAVVASGILWSGIIMAASALIS